MNAPDTDNWVRVRAECTSPGFLRKLRAEICQDVIEANKQFEPDKSFSLSSKEETAFVRVFRRLKGEKNADAFVSFKPEGDSSIAVSLHCRNGDSRALDSEQPLGVIDLVWDHEGHRCLISFGEFRSSTFDLRRHTLGKLFFE